MAAKMLACTFCRQRRVDEDFHLQLVVIGEKRKHEAAHRVLAKVGETAPRQAASGIALVFMRLDETLERLGVSAIPRVVFIRRRGHRRGVVS